MPRLLIVEDDAVMRSALTLSLRGAGYEVEAAENGLKALEVAGKNRFDCIISDIRMPGLDGVSMAARFKERTPRVKTILITGYSDDEPLIRALNLGVDGLLKKPFGMKDLLRMVSLKLHEKETEEAREEKWQHLVAKLEDALGKEKTRDLVGKRIEHSEGIAEDERVRLSTLMEIGRMAELRRETEVALQAYEEALALLQGIGSEPEEFPIRLSLSNLFFDKGEKSLALFHAREAIGIAEKQEDRELLLDAHLHAARLLIDQDAAGSMRHLDASKNYLAAESPKEKRALVTVLESALAIRRGNPDEAKGKMEDFLLLGQRHFLPQVMLATRGAGLRSLFLCLQENIQSENAKWLLEEIAPFFQREIFEAAKSGVALYDIVSPFLSEYPQGGNAALQILSFGRLSMILDGMPLSDGSWKSLKGRSLFLYMAHEHPKLLSEEHLLDTFWPNLNPEKGRHALRTTLYFIRRTLDGKNGRTFLFAEKQKFGIRADAGLSCDFMTFRKNSHQARTAWEKGERDRAALLMKDAERLYRGSFLEGWSEEWSLAARDRYQEMYSWILASLAEYLRREENWSETLLYAQKALRADPTMEEAHCFAIEAFLRTGRREEALRQYNACKAILKKELNVEPSERTRLLYKKAAELHPV